MAQDWAYSFYHSPAWRKNRAGYLQSHVDTSGHVVKEHDGRWFWTEDGLEIEVPSECVVPPGMCERCFRMGELRPADTVHHVTHLTPDNIGDPHYALSYSNFMRVCRDCHAAIHAGDNGPRVMFDEDGIVIGRRDEFSDLLAGLAAM